MFQDRRIESLQMSETDKKIEHVFGKAYELYEAEDFAAAFFAYLELAEQGYSNCQSFVGWMYFSGKGTKKNYKEAERWLKKAADSNDVEAQFYLGKLLFIKEDYRNAISWLEKSAAQSYAPSIYKLGCIYDRSEHINNDKDKAFDLFEQASKLGHLFAHKEYAVKLLKGYKGFPGFLKGFFDYLKIFFMLIKLGSGDPHDERIRT